MTSIRHAITQGEHMVSDDPNVCISTLLGSCVSVCLWDPRTRIGGMNHMLLAHVGATSTQPDFVGINAMELLINALQKRGATRQRLQAKVFGGAQMVDGLSSIGPDNAKFALEYLERESITCTGQSIGGDAARQIVFWPTTGVARQKVKQKANLVETVSRPNVSGGNDLELF